MANGKSSLSDRQIAIVKGLLARGEMGDRITWFMSLLMDSDINIGRISETKTNFYQHRDPHSRRSIRYQAIAAEAVQYIPLLEELRHALSKALNDILSGKYPTTHNREIKLEDIEMMLANYYSKTMARTERLFSGTSEVEKRERSDMEMELNTLKKRLAALENTFEKQKKADIENVRRGAERSWRK